MYTYILIKSQKTKMKNHDCVNKMKPVDIKTALRKLSVTFTLPVMRLPILETIIVAQDTTRATRTAIHSLHPQK